MIKPLQFVVNKFFDGTVWVAEKVAPLTSGERVVEVSPEHFQLILDSKAEPQDAILWEPEDFELS
jgi:hypothetical protein